LKRLCQLLFALALAGALGCGAADPNKNLKPVDSNAPRPQIGNDAPGRPPGDKSPSMIK
jgi:hypothetical protein